MDQSSLSTAEEALLRRTADLAVPDSPSAPTPSPLSAFDDHPTPDVDTPMIDALALSFQDSGQAEAETHVANLEVLDDVSSLSSFLLNVAQPADSCILY